jgi:hypothetical protein
LLIDDLRAGARGISIYFGKMPIFSGIGIHYIWGKKWKRYNGKMNTACG